MKFGQMLVYVSQTFLVCFQLSVEEWKLVPGPFMTL